ncbi:hypothetical protein ACJIZ3_011970 [Penstemon smallii]|uniref:IRK-interacting protein n=1 Tax=Penstemon smallii TaxID=265156 RepID=A0ABD3UNI4_9LAMI
MAAMYQEISGEIRNGENDNGNGNEISRREIKAAIAKGMELRALHASLSPATRTFPSSASPVSRHAPHFSAHDYPVFTPSYEDEPLPGYRHTLSDYEESWGEYNLDGRNLYETTILSDYRTTNASFTRNRISNYSRSRRNSLGDIKSLSSCNKYNPALIGNDSDGHTKNYRKSNIIVPLTDSHVSLHSKPRNIKGLSLSWLFPKLRKKNKNVSSPKFPKSEEVSSSQMLEEFGMVSIETLKKELVKAHESRNLALIEVSEMKSTLGELGQKLEHLETYCEELKKALRQALQVKKSSPTENLTKLPKRGKLIDENAEEARVEEFLQVLSDARLSVKQFCKTLLGQIKETDVSLVDNLNSILQPYKVSLNSDLVLYHLEAIINQSLYQDFENCTFQKNGTPKFLDPQQDRQTRFKSFLSLRNLSWDEVSRKGTKYYCAEFSKFCDQKMSDIIATLGWIRPWAEELLQRFFVAAKCLWLLHLLAFSFNPVLGILRVDEYKPFDSHYMEDTFSDRQGSKGSRRVKIMVNPGFYVHDRVLKCKVLCRYKSSIV